VETKTEEVGINILEFMERDIIVNGRTGLEITKQRENHVVL